MWGGDFGRRIAFTGLENGAGRRFRKSASSVAKGEPNEALKTIGMIEACRSNKGEGNGRLLLISLCLARETVKPGNLPVPRTSEGAYPAFRLCGLDWVSVSTTSA